jgi:ubiquinone/menaquinone biosynthesis C-methylase UbiE
MNLDELQRVHTSRRQTQVSYDRLARWYDWFSGDEWRYTLAGLQMLAPRLGEHLLEIGPGTGRALAWSARAIGPGGLAVGLDLSAGMLERARRRLTRVAPVRPADLCQGDALQLPFPASTFDHVFLSFTLELFDTPEIPGVLAECRRALRPGGRLGVVSLAKENRAAVRIYEWFHERWPAAVDCRPIHARVALEAAGFKTREARRMLMWGLPVELVLGIKKDQVS